MKIALASSNGKKVDLHFADASHYLIFGVDGKKVNFLELREKPIKPIKDHSDRWIKSMEILGDCKAVLCSKIGQEPKRSLKNNGIEVFECQKEVKEAIKDYLLNNR